MYEYRTLESHTPPAASQLDELHVNGWEFVQVLFWPVQKIFYTYLRKPVVQ